MTLKINKDKLKNAALMGLFVLASMNFGAKFFYYVFAALVVILISQPKLKITLTSLLYLLLGGLMAAYNSSEGLLSMIRCFAPIAFYWVGFNITMEEAQKTSLTGDISVGLSKYARTILLMIATGSYTHFMLNFITNFGQGIGRNTNDIWTGQIMAATGQVALACIMVGFSIAMLFTPGTRIFRYIAVLIILSMLAYNLILAGRTMIVMLLLVMTGGLVYYVFAQAQITQKMKTILGVSFGLLFVAILIMTNVGGSLDYIMESNLFARMNKSFGIARHETSRIYRKKRYISSALQYPFGGCHMRQEYGYAHDLLLDGYDEYGVIGFALLLMIVILSVTELYKFSKHSSFTLPCKMGFLCVYFAILLEFCVEPILAGMPWLFSCYSLLNGCVAAMNLNKIPNDGRLRNESFAD